jgi:hypothetical protein
MIEHTSDYYTLGEVWRAVFKRRKPPTPERQVEVLQPVWMPRTEVERAAHGLTLRPLETPTARSDLSAQAVGSPSII